MINGVKREEALQRQLADAIYVLEAVMRSICREGAGGKFVECDNTAAHAAAIAKLAAHGRFHIVGAGSSIRGRWPENDPDRGRAA